MIASINFTKPTYDRNIFSSKDCPEWAKCAVTNSDGIVCFMDTIPNGINEREQAWSFPNWHFVRCFYSSQKGNSDWRNSLLIREAGK